MLFTAMPNRNKVPKRSLPLSSKGTEDGWRTAQSSSTVLKGGNCPFGSSFHMGRIKIGQRNLLDVSKQVSHLRYKVLYLDAQPGHEELPPT